MGIKEIDLEGVGSLIWHIFHISQNTFCSMCFGQCTTEISDVTVCYTFFSSNGLKMTTAGQNILPQINC